MEWIGFRFDYVIEANLSEAQNTFQQHGLTQVNQAALARRADGLFPPRVESIFLDMRMNVVDDPHLLQILQRPYSKKWQPTHDYSLTSKRIVQSGRDLVINRLSILEEYVSRDDWESLCSRARQQSELLLRKQPDFKEYCECHAHEASRVLEDRLEQLHQRLVRNSLNAKSTTLVQEIDVEQELKAIFQKGILYPKIRLDSIGFYIVSGHLHPLLAGEDDDW
jgi:ATP-dependent helicase HepA